MQARRFVQAPLPPHFVTFLKHAVDARQAGRPEACAVWLEAASYLHDVDTAAIVERIDQLLRDGHPWHAIQLGELATALGDHDATLQFSLGYALQSSGHHARAADAYRRALAVDANHPQLRNNLAAAIRMAGGDTHEALALLEDAIAANPVDVNAWINLVNAKRDQFDLAGALAAGARAIELAPLNAAAANNYSLALKDAQRWQEAEHHANAACQLDPDNATYRFNRGILQLLHGRYAQGWPDFDARWTGAAELRGTRPRFPMPPWRGESLDGKTLLVWGEQGFGDLLQFSRFVPALAERVHAQRGRIVWNSFPQMGDLLVRSLAQHVDAYTAGGGIESLPPCDYEIPLMSVPFALGIDAAAIRASGPWLVPDPVRSAAWRRQLAAEPRLKVGLAWTGSATHQRNQFRRVGWERYAAHFRGLQNVAFYSLQPDAAGDVDAARRAGLDIVDPTAAFATFDDTAAFVDALDLVITVCTSTAHLSGAIGQRTWVLLDVNPHWPWLLDRTDSPWYPGATLYRQRDFAQWEPVLEAVTRDLTRLAAGRTAER